MTDSPSVPGTLRDWRAGSTAVGTALLLAACAGAPSLPQGNATVESADSTLDRSIAAAQPAVSATSEDAPAPAGLFERIKAALASRTADGTKGSTDGLAPPLFTPAQALDEANTQAAAAAELETQSAVAQVAGGPSIRFKKGLGERNLPSEGEEVDRGTASWYGLQFHGRLTANGERYDMYDLTAAHKTLPFNTIVSVHNLQTGRSVRVRINDRGPFVDGRVIDLSKAAADKLGMADVGLRPVSLVVEEWPAEMLGARDAKARRQRRASTH